MFIGTFQPSKLRNHPHYLLITTVFNTLTGKETSLNYVRLSVIETKLGCLHTRVTLSLISTLSAISGHSNEKTIRSPFTGTKGNNKRTDQTNRCTAHYRPDSNT